MMRLTYVMMLSVGLLSGVAIVSDARRFAKDYDAFATEGQAAEAHGHPKKRPAKVDEAFREPIDFWKGVPLNSGFTISLNLRMVMQKLNNVLFKSEQNAIDNLVFAFSESGLRDPVEDFKIRQLFGSIRSYINSDLHWKHTIDSTFEKVFNGMRRQLDPRMEIYFDETYQATCKQVALSLLVSERIQGAFSQDETPMEHASAIVYLWRENVEKPFLFVKDSGHKKSWELLVNFMAIDTDFQAAQALYNAADSYLKNFEGELVVKFQDWNRRNKVLTKKRSQTHSRYVFDVQHIEAAVALSDVLVYDHKKVENNLIANHYGGNHVTYHENFYKEKMLKFTEYIIGKTSNLRP